MPSSRQNLRLFFLSLFTPALSHPLAFHCICMRGAASKPLSFVQYLVTFLVHSWWWYVCACCFVVYSMTRPLTHSIFKMFLLSMVDRDVGLMDKGTVYHRQYLLSPQHISCPAFLCVPLICL